MSGRTRPRPSRATSFGLQSVTGHFIAASWSNRVRHVRDDLPAERGTLAHGGQGTQERRRPTVSTAARYAYANGWSSLPPVSDRAKYLFRIARILQEALA